MADLVDVFGAATVAQDVHVLVGTRFWHVYPPAALLQNDATTTPKKSFCALSPAEAKGAQGEKVRGGGETKARKVL